MPAYGIVVLGIQIFTAVHVVRTRRPLYWIFIILAMPLLGSIVYFFAEMLPELMHSRAARQAAHDVQKLIDPDRDYRALVTQLEIADTVENRRALAEECLRRGSIDEAVSLYESASTGLHRDDPALLLGLARAYFAAGRFEDCTGALDRLKAANPAFESADAHLLYARGLEGQGRTADALAEYAALARCYPGEEAKCRWALLLRSNGEVAQARDLFEAIARSVERGNKHYFRAQRDWYEIAKQNLA